MLRALDKLKKAGREKVAEELRDGAGLATSQVDDVLAFAELAGANDVVLGELERRVAGESAIGREGVSELKELLAACAAAGVPQKRLRLDVSIARGFDYYTGTVFETFLDALPGIGSICSGGRYDNLAGLYTRQELPGIGASLGLDRLLAAMEELNMIERGLDAGGSVHRLFRAQPVAGLPETGGGRPSGGFRRGSVLRIANEARPTTEIRRPARPPRRARRRQPGIRSPAPARSKICEPTTSQTVPMAEDANEIINAVRNLLEKRLN